MGVQGLGGVEAAGVRVGGAQVVGPGLGGVAAAGERVGGARVGCGSDGAGSGCGPRLRSRSWAVAVSGWSALVCVSWPGFPCQRPCVSPGAGVWRVCLPGGAQLGCWGWYFQAKEGPVRAARAACLLVGGVSGRV